jgi:hypothetical protein
MVKDSKIYYVAFKNLVDHRRLVMGCRGLHYTDKYVVYECGKGVEKFIELHAESVIEVDKDEDSIYTLLEKDLPFLFSHK